MEFREVVRRRRMVRRYADRSVDPAVLDRMLEHAIRAPSAGFTQGWAFLRLDTPDDVARFWRSTSPDPDARNRWLDGMRTAPVIIVPLSNRNAYLSRYAEPDKGWEPDESRWPIPYWHVDTGMAALLILQTAVDEGLGACFFGIPPGQVEEFRAEFGVPGEYTPIGAITVGHPVRNSQFHPVATVGKREFRRGPGETASGSPARRGRRGTAEVVHTGHW